MVRGFESPVVALFEVGKCLPAGLVVQVELWRWRLVGRGVVLLVVALREVGDCSPGLVA